MHEQHAFTLPFLYVFKIIHMSLVLLTLIQQVFLNISSTSDPFRRRITETSVMESDLTSFVFSVVARGKFAGQGGLP